MKVILLEKFRKLGQVGDVVEVKNGYARNYLIPNHKAIQANKTNVAEFEAKKSELILQSQNKEQLARNVAEKIKNKIVTITKQASDDGRLYGSITNNEISEQLTAKTEENINRKQVHFSVSIKSIGIYQIEIDLGEGVFTSVYVNVARSESEAEEIEKKFLSGDISLGALSLDMKDRKRA
jgi:large subunit ribosomal protein L9